MGKLEMRLSLKGLDCANCANKIEKKTNDLDEVKEASLNFTLGIMNVEIQPNSNKQEVKEKIIKIVKDLEPDVKVEELNKDKVQSSYKIKGDFKAGNAKKISKDLKVSLEELDTSKQENSKKKQGSKDNKLKENMPLILGIIIYIIGILFGEGKAYEPIIFLVSYILVGGEVVVSAFRNILKGEIFDENFLMMIATFGAFLIKQYPEAVAVMIFYEIGEMFQGYAVNKSRKSISSLMDIRSDYANLVFQNKEKKVSPESVNIGDIIIIRPGERVPLDGIVTEGNSQLDTAALTGETVPRSVKKDKEILSGSINLSGVLKVKVTKRYGDSTVARILELVENASSKKAPTEKFITKFARYYTPIVVFLAVLLAIIPPILLEEARFSDWLYRALIFLVVSCPCALVISIPLGLFAGLGAASKKGVLIKGGNYLEALKKAEIVVFDKTGTLTKGTFNVVKIENIDIQKDELLKIAATLESFSNHPIGQSIVKFYGKTTNKEIIKDYKEISGKGIKAKIEEREILIGNYKLMEDNNIGYSKQDEIGTIVHVSINNKYKGYIVISDEIKENSKQAVKCLKNLGIKKTVMLTGDNKNIGEKVSKIIGIDKAYTELLPADKVDKVEELLNEKSEKGKLIFVGDGINDAPVLARADIGVAMGGIGSDAAIEAADVVLMRDDPSALIDAIKISKRTSKILWQNIIFSLVVKIGVLILSAVGIANMWCGVFADVGVTLLAVLNSMRALKNNK